MVLAFHLFHGFSSAFQTLGINHRRYNSLIKNFGVVFALLIPTAFALIPVLIYLWR
jgi:succinate dehydrogenase / fumarate reductase cytochrome b subunit